MVSESADTGTLLLECLLEPSKYREPQQYPPSSSDFPGLTDSKPTGIISVQTSAPTTPFFAVLVVFFSVSVAPSAASEARGLSAMTLQAYSLTMFAHSEHLQQQRQREGRAP